MVIGTAILDISVAFDGDGATTYLICTAALLPLYRRLGIKLQYMATVLLLSIGVMNMLPWGGPTARAASAMKVDVGELFMLLLPIMICGLAWVVLVAIIFGLRERRRLGVIKIDLSEETGQVTSVTNYRYLFNSALTIALLVMLILGMLPMATLFMIAFAVAMLVNFPNLKHQKKLLAKHAENVLAIVSLIFAAGIFTGILSGTGMVDAMSNSLVNSLPASAGPLARHPHGADQHAVHLLHDKRCVLFWRFTHSCADSDKLRNLAYADGRCFTDWTTCSSAQPACCVNLPSCRHS